MTTLDLAPVAALRELLTAAGIRNAEDPGGLTPPGVHIKVTGFRRITLGAPLAPTVRVFLVVPNGKHDRVTAALVTLADQLLELVDPDSDITATSVLLPDGGGPLPALAFDLNLY